MTFSYQSSTEKPIEPLLPICDPHHHMWDRPGNRYMPEEFIKDVNGNNVVRTVFVEFYSGYRTDGPLEMRPVGETEFMQKISAQSLAGNTHIAAGIIGHANLTLGEKVAPVLEAHIEAGKGLFKGIRHTSAWDASPEIPSYMSPSRGLLLDQQFRQGFAQLKRFNLSFDAWLYFHQLPELADLAKAFPDTSIIVDHIGGPILTGPYAGRRNEVIAEWKRGITLLARYPNVSIKLGGLGMPRCGFDWHIRQPAPGSTDLAKGMMPYYLYCIEQCGIDRCMFESNFPVDKVSYSYTNMWNAFKLIVNNFTPAEKSALFHDTAVRVYRLAGG